MASVPASSTSLSNVTSSRARTEVRTAVLASLNSAGSSYDSRYQQRATDLRNNAAAITTQEAGVEKQTVALAKESAKLQKELDKTAKEMKGFGDMQNWAEMLERDFLVLEETMRLADEESGLQQCK